VTSLARFRSTIASSLSSGKACANIIAMAAVEREMPAWSDDPTFLAGNECILEGMGKAGVPE
jgi:hypothetical protein